MAKSVRSKSQRKNRAIKRAAVFKPPADDRARRLALKDRIPLGQSPMPVDTPPERPQHGTLQSPGTASKKGMAAKRFNFYGLSRKELCF